MDTGRSTSLPLVLGTAQFGLDYGIANRSGRVSDIEARRIFDCARNFGIKAIDTAISYGEAEARLGELGVADFEVVTKVPALPSAPGNVTIWLREQVEASLRRLRVDRLHGLLLHHARDLSGPHAGELWDAMARMVVAGHVERIGVSIYAPSDLEPVLPSGRLRLVQAPMNVFDRRIINAGLLTRLVRDDIEVHLRSAFLQGLLLMGEEAIPSYFRPWLTQLANWQAWCRSQSLSPLHACLMHVRAAAPSSKVVVGCETAGQLLEIISASQLPGVEAPVELCSSDLRLINPGEWSHQ